jgi:WD40 repeat protein
MNIPDRFTRLIYSPEKNVLIAADVRGRLHKLDLELNLIQTSSATSYNIPINAIVSDGKYIFTKNRRGAIGKWDLETLRPLDIYDDYPIRDENDIMENEEPSPTAARGIGLFNGKVFTNNGYSQVVVLDAETFEVLEIRNPMSEESFIDCINTECSEVHAVSETCGLLHLGNIETGEFPIKIQVDGNNVHWVKYDSRHNRFWATQDAGTDDGKFEENGVVTVDLDGSNFQKYLFTNDDIEFLEFDHEYKFVYVGGFDGYIYVFDNEEKELKLSNIIGPFSYQILNLAYVSDDQIYVLLQNGEVLWIDKYGKQKGQANFKNSCIWALEPHPKDDSVVYCAKDDGIDIIQYGSSTYNSIYIHRLAQHKHPMGIVRRVKPMNDGSYLAITQGQYLYCADEQGNIKWYKRLLGVPRSLDVNKEQDELLVSTDAGIVLELKTEDGSVINSYDFKVAVYAVGYTLDGKKVIGIKSGKLFIYDGIEKVHTMNLETYPKRFLFSTEDKMYLVGAFGVIEINLKTYEIEKQWTELLVNTKENAVILSDHVYIVSYGYQMGSYRYKDGEMIDLIEDFIDFPKAITGRIENGQPILLVGGRGGYINAYRIIDGVPLKVKEVYL